MKGLRAFQGVALAVAIGASNGLLAGDEPTEEELRSFAEAYVQIENVRQSHLAALHHTSGDPDEVKQAQREAYEETVRVIEEEGLSVEQYNRIGVSVQQDENIRSQVIEMISER